jgi:hypothetical protein
MFLLVRGGRFCRSSGNSGNFAGRNQPLSAGRPGLLQFATGAPDFALLAKLPHEDLVLELCERWVAAVVADSERGKAA